MISVGEQVPDFTLASGDGQPVVLSEVTAAAKAVVLVFYLFDFSGG